MAQCKFAASMMTSTDLVQHQKHRTLRLLRDAIPATPGRAGGRSAQRWPGCRAASQLAASQTGAPSSEGRPGPSLHPQRRGTCNVSTKPWLWLRSSHLAVTQAVCRQHLASSATRAMVQEYCEPQQASCLSVSCKDACADHLCMRSVSIGKHTSPSPGGQGGRWGASPAAALPSLCSSWHWPSLSSARMHVHPCGMCAIVQLRLRCMPSGGQPGKDLCRQVQVYGAT